MQTQRSKGTDAAAWQVLERAVWVTVSAVTEAGLPFSVPMHAAVDPERRMLYLHGARRGETWEILRRGAAVSVCAVSRAAVVPERFTTAYDSVIVRGRAEIVTDEGERVKAMLLLCRQLDPRAMGGFEAEMDRRFEAAYVARIVPETVHLRRHDAPHEAHACHHGADEGR